MATAIKAGFERLIFLHHEIGCHRDRKWGLREVFGLPTLRNQPFLQLADRFRRAYRGKDTPRHRGWPAQREAIRWLVDHGIEGIYALEPKTIRLKKTSFGSYGIVDGNHRAIALYMLGEREVRALL